MNKNIYYIKENIKIKNYIYIFLINIYKKKIKKFKK